MNTSFFRLVILINGLCLSQSFAQTSAPDANQQKAARQKAQEDSGAIFQLQKVNFDSWTAALISHLQNQSTAKISQKTIAQLSVEILKSVETAQTEQEIFSEIRRLFNHTQLTTAAEFQQLAEAILTHRQSLRHRVDLSLKAKRDSLFLLQLMAEEVLYVGAKKFPDFPAEVKISEQLDHLGPQQTLRGFQVQSGDVSLAKSTGFGSSAFIALSMSHPHIFSHSTPIFVDEKNQLASPEAEIEDGVKIRPMEKEYIQGSKTRQYIYRYQGEDSTVVAKAQSSLTAFIANMYKRTDGDPYNKPSYIYDFSMTPGNIETRGLFCSSVAYEVYLEGGLVGPTNPYPMKNWSSVSDARKSLLAGLNMNTNRIPAPGDVELNSNFRLVGARIDVTKLEQERIETAIIDGFLHLLNTQEVILEEISKSLKSISNEPVNREELKATISQLPIPDAIKSHLSKIDSIPDSINLKQMIFFAFLNEYLTPKMREAMKQQLAGIETQQGKLLGPQALRMLAIKQMADELPKLQQTVSVLAAKYMSSASAPTCRGSLTSN